MYIATNTPESFYPKNGMLFIPLGDKSQSVSMIILMLEKNWGSLSIDRIKALMHWVSSYPKDVPCYIVGCETKIPGDALLDNSLQRYVHKERDDAIRSLCDEVLKRSSSIGVREEVTYVYLTKMLGYSEELIDVIYAAGSENNSYLLHAFLNKNNSALNCFEKDFLRFQVQPRVLYERPINCEKNIVVTPPYITASNETVRLSSDIRIDGEIRALWCETNNIYHQFLLSERADAFVCAVLPYAMRTGKDIVCEVPVSEQFLHNLNEILVPNLCAGDVRLYKSKIIAPSDSSSLIAGNAVATGMSCGVDSFYTTSLYKSSKFKSMNLTHLYCGNYLYGNSGPIFERAASAAQDLNLPLVQTATNINEFFGLPHLYTHFFKTMFGVLSLRKLFRVYYYSSAEDFSGFNLRDNSIRSTADSELLLLYVFNSPDFQIITGGGGYSRFEKTRAICSFPTAQKFLNVCLYPNLDVNCGKCDKCLRTLLMIDMLNSLELFKEVFNINDYMENRIDAFVYLVTQKRSKTLAVVYDHFMKTEQNLINQAEAIVNK